MQPIASTLEAWKMYVYDSPFSFSNGHQLLPKNVMVAASLLFA
jgi:hypothetical protein